MLAKVKTALRIVTNDLDGEITDLIEASKADLNLAGIINIDESDPLIVRAIILYSKTNFSFSADNQRFQTQYTFLKCTLANSKKYNTEVI